MRSLLRLVLVAIALLTSGALQVAAAIGDDACCAGEAPQHGEEAPCPDCPPGLACGCCPIRGAVHGDPLVIVPAASSGVAIAVASAEPTLVRSPADIFHPPRA